jgi:HD-like signal output (HDOD) protein
MNDDASLRSMARIIEQDPALAGNLLQVANSPYYRTTATPVASLERAITQVGTQGLRSLIATALVQPVLTGDTGRFSRFPERIWEYTVYVATAAEAHANRFEEADGFAAQLLGLLHGLGAIVVYRVLHEQYAAHPELEPDPAAYALLLEARTGPTARRIAEAWELSGPLATTLDETVDSADFAAASPLARSLRFGRLAGALVFLCRMGRIGEVPARAALLAAHPPDPRVEKTWERLVKAYIRA